MICIVRKEEFCDCNGEQDGEIIGICTECGGYVKGTPKGDKTAGGK